jgi:UrcA family protein
MRLSLDRDVGIAMKNQLFAAALTAAAAAAGAAFAGSLDASPGAPGGHGPVRVLVIESSRGLDLTSPAGADRFVAHLDAAVNRACNARTADDAAFYGCRSQALAQAVTYVRSPAVRRRFAALPAQGGVRLATR